MLTTMKNGLHEENEKVLNSMTFVEYSCIQPKLCCMQKNKSKWSKNQTERNRSIIGIVSDIQNPMIAQDLEGASLKKQPIKNYRTWKIS
jgi:hypothetical protein